MSTLYLVATPIGNLEDLSPRAVRILSEVMLIAAEDTRHTAKLLNHFKITTKSTSYYDHNKKKKLENILNALQEGDVALVSDAGSPGLNDPGFLLVKAAIEARHTISPIPGPSAPIAALITSGLPTDKFLYLGYLPRKENQRIKSLKDIQEFPHTIIYFETPHRLIDSLSNILEILGDRQIAIASELTKLYESIFRGTITDALGYFEAYPAKGEYTLVLHGHVQKTTKWDSTKLENSINVELESNKQPSQIARDLAKISGWSRREIYNQITKSQNK